MKARITADNLYLEPDEDDIAVAMEAVAEQTTHQVFWDLLEPLVCNGWMWIPPEAIGALTDAPILSEDFTLTDSGEYVPASDAARVFWHRAYETENPVVTWSEGRAVVFTGAIMSLIDATK